MQTAVEPATDDAMVRGLRGFGPLGTTAFVAIALLGPVLEPLAGILVVLWVRASRTPWRDIGYVRPASWLRTAIGGLAFGIALKLVMKTVVTPLLGGPALNPAYHNLVGNTPALVGMALYVLVAAGFNEETVFRGFLFERLGSLLGSGAAAKTVIVVVTTAWFAAVHYPEQGLAGVEQAAVTGAVFGAVFAATGRLWMLMIAHAAFDLAALAIIYWNLESPMAHVFFR